MDRAILEPPQRSETETIASLAERYLAPHQPSDYRLSVNQKAIRLGTRRWLVEVNVEPKGKEVRSEDVVDRIVAANQDLERDYPRYIRLTQMVPTRDELL